jgi:hypothetical protein
MEEGSFLNDELARNGARPRPLNVAICSLENEINVIRLKKWLARMNCVSIN